MHRRVLPARSRSRANDAAVLALASLTAMFSPKTNLSNFTGTTYRNVSRSYLEFQQFYDTIIHNNPPTIVPALPLAQTSAPTDEEDVRIVRIMLQRWLSSDCNDPILLHDEELRSFIESDFGYQPTPRPRRKTSSGFGLIRRHVPDEDEELQRARFELTRLEGQFFDAAKALDKVSKSRKSQWPLFALLAVRLRIVIRDRTYSYARDSFGARPRRNGQQAGQYRDDGDTSAHWERDAQAWPNMAQPR